MGALIGAVGLPNELQATPACLCALQWQGSPDSNVAGYAVYCSVAGSSTTNRLDVGAATSVTLKNLIASSTYYFYVVAYDGGQVESGPSNLLPYNATAISTVQISQVANGAMNLEFHVAPTAACHVEYTETLSPPAWTILSSATGDSNGLVTVNDPIVPGHNRFYRAVVP
ncbi:MAG TPA: fibronectin type III domain-containing protein [Verrucomicrobiae bacterium]|nr:fibronectin type III domain-containing protein [Verrucomicrobiae bacterium]